MRCKSRALYTLKPVLAVRAHRPVPDHQYGADRAKRQRHGEAQRPFERRQGGAEGLHTASSIWRLSGGLTVAEYVHCPRSR